MPIGLVLLIMPELATNCKREKKTRKKTTDSSTVEQNDINVALNLKTKQSKKNFLSFIYIQQSKKIKKMGREGYFSVKSTDYKE